MSWSSALPALATAAVLLLMPGLVLAGILRLRGLWLWAFAGPASVSVVVVGSVVGPLLGQAWSPIAVLIAFAILLAIALAIRLTLLRGSVAASTDRPRRRVWLTSVGLVMGGILVGAQLVVIIGAPENISQTFDNVFHLNAVRYILDTGDASPFAVGRMTGDAVWFYPAAWHGIVALVSQVSGASIPLASNAVLLIVAAVVWPAAIVLLTRVLSGGGRWIEATAGLIAAALPAFPFLLADYGVLYPFLLAVATLPAIIAATIVVLRLRKDRVGVLPAAIVALGSTPGLALAHPGVFVAWMVAAVVCAVCAYAFLLRGTAPARVKRTATICLIAGLLIAVAAGYALRPAVEARGWLPVGSMGQAAGEALFLSPHYPAVPLLVALLLWLGVYDMIRRRSRTDVVALALFVVFSSLYVIAQALPFLGIRDLITGSWYNDATRLAALLPLVAIPIASVGALRAWTVGVGLWRTRRVGARVTLLTVLAAVLVFQAHSQVVLIRWAQPTYEYEADSPLLSTDELALLERLPSEVGADDVVAGNPWTGTSLAYAFADREVLMPHILTEETADETTINESLRDAAAGSAVCDALERQGVSYVLDFGELEVHNERHELVGLERLSSSSAVELVDREGSARLYKIVGCEE